jgi:hypothetical protein
VCGALFGIRLFDNIKMHGTTVKKTEKVEEIIKTHILCSISVLFSRKFGKMW